MEILPREKANFMKANINDTIDELSKDFNNPESIKKLQEILQFIHDVTNKNIVNTLAVS
ncbi:MAG: hypothetical protein LBP53_05585 [Candidatus Peribacteria bacterium]|jgi:hypothetical protein|nr:hypothetical protein [Candidatus Peribacteria bacterium]